MSDSGQRCEEEESTVRVGVRGEYGLRRVTAGVSLVR